MSAACECKTHCHVMVFWVVARVFWAVTCVAMCLPMCFGWLLGCYGQLLVFLRVCQGVLDGCQDVAMWLLGCLGLFVACEKLPAMLWCSGWLPGCY